MNCGLWDNAPNFSADHASKNFRDHSFTSNHKTVSIQTMHVHAYQPKPIVALSCKFTNDCERLMNAIEQLASARMSLTCVVCRTREHEKC